MIQNYLTLAIRNLRKNGLYSFLNITGLAIGIAACLLIVLYVVHEMSYDRWNPLADRIVRPASDINFGGHHYQMAVVASVLGPEAGKELPEVQAWCRFRQYGTYLVKREGASQQNIREEDVLTVDSSFFELFPLKVLEGDPARCLTQPKTMAISRSRAEKYFSSPQMALGQTLVLENDQRWQVTAVYEDIPVNSHFRADLLLSMNGNEEVKTDPPFWASNNNFQTYLLLRKGTDLAAFNKKFERLSAEKIAITVQQLLGSTVEEVEKTGQYAHYYLQNLPDIHLYSDLSIELAPNGSIRYVWIFSAIAAFILLIACINFMNLATARSAGRAKEVGMRKVLGGQRPALIGQFLSESFVIAAIAVVFAVLIAAVAMPWYRDLTGRHLVMPWSSSLFWLSLAGGTVIVGLLAGSYPAFFLSAFDSLRVLKGQVAGLGRGGGFRSALVVFQFTISVALIIATMLVFRQLNYIQNKKLGFQKSQIIILDDAYALGDKIYTLKAEMLRHPAIESATVSGYLPIPSNRSDNGFSKVRALDKDNTVSMQRWEVDNDYLATLGMEIVQGRSFDPARITDSTAVIVNETAARLWGFDDPIGQKIYAPAHDIQSAPRPEDFQEFTIIGVVKDFHWSSLRDNIGALCFQLGKSRGLAAFRYKGSDTAPVIAALEKEWKSLSPDQPFSYRFLDESFARMYEAEQRIGAIAGIFGLLSVLVSCLGLFGLAAFTTEQRTKEIGIRKVLGASVTGITALLAKDFMKLVLVSIVIAIPIAWYFMQKWLSDFAYRIEIQWWMFAAAGAVAVTVAFLTVSFQSIKAALANPVKSLRSE
ncbi:MAG TPA: ABC transporter permease [Saprospiraceae bacterium]|nr:ABC transporter permease [Saprospiraceae bacterium]